ncbi:hypothetical protein [Niallia endozanthoxylica]|uniref:hypothetical protein n=1 Tax=Niallia endozanthoxylica TaxID=2036016 RepID=UPI00168B2784|nr:hypothetical protein [Niallia endozanthoxylica]
MTDNQHNSEQVSGLDYNNPIRERLRSRPAADFSGATRRRLALMYRGRELK